MFNKMSYCQTTGFLIKKMGMKYDMNFESIHYSKYVFPDGDVGYFVPFEDQNHCLRVGSSLNKSVANTALHNQLVKMTNDYIASCNCS